jgi:hypothetical protein
MGFRFRRSIKIAPGFRINLSKRGPSLSVGSRGASVNFSARGARSTLGIPGTGISYSTSSRQGRPKKNTRLDAVETIKLAADPGSNQTFEEQRAVALYQLQLAGWEQVHLEDDSGEFIKAQGVSNIIAIAAGIAASIACFKADIPYASILPLVMLWSYLWRDRIRVKIIFEKA